MLKAGLPAIFERKHLQLHLSVFSVTKTVPPSFIYTINVLFPKSNVYAGSVIPVTQINYLGLIAIPLPFIVKLSFFFYNSVLVSVHKKKEE